MNNCERIKILEAEINSIKAQHFSTIIAAIKDAENKGLPLLVNSRTLEKLQKYGKIRLLGVDAESLYNTLKNMGVVCALHTVFREIDPYSYWPGDEISGFKDVVLGFVPEETKNE